MSESGRPPAEGVRIIKAEEARAALEAGEVAGRRPEEELRFGDVPPAPSGPRPAHRFPLPDSVDPARAVELPPLAEVENRRTGGAHFASAAGPRPPGPTAPEPQAEPSPPVADRTTELGVSAIPEEGITVSGAAPELPHWTDPPTGEVPRLRFDEPEPAPDREDLEAWKAIGARGVRWREDEAWDDGDELADLADDSEPLGALDSTRAEHSDLYSFDDDFERVTARRGSPAEPADFAEAEPDPEPVAVPVSGRDLAARPSAGARAATRGGTATRRRAGSSARGSASNRPGRGPVGGNDGGDIASRVVIGAVLIVALLVAYAIGSKALVVLAALAVTASAAEGYNMTFRAGFRPATLLGLVATAGTVLGAYWKGPVAIPIVAVLLVAGTMLWYVLGVVEARPLANAAVTVFVYVWVGVLGAFSSVLLMHHKGRGLFLGAVVVAVAADIAAFAVGRAVGNRPMAAGISPGKTVEGYIGGVIGAVVVGLIVGKTLAPWGGMKHGLLLGLVIGVFAPAGDLFESTIKRDLGLKDSGTTLGGHGGLLDRFDALLLALPAAYFVAVLTHIVAV